MGSNHLKNIFLKLCRWTLGLLGIAAAESCDVINDIFGVAVAEYGCPYSDYVVKGKVTDKNSGKALSQIEVEPFRRYLGPDGQFILDPIYNKDTTKIDGIFDMSGQDMVHDEKIVLRFRDLDASDGDYGETEVIVKLTDKNTEDAGSWYEGKFVYDAGEIKLEEKPE